MQDPIPEERPLRDAASVLIVRRDLPGGAHVLMGMRGAGAAFMPSKFVFPGGAVEPADSAVPLLSPLAATETRRLSAETSTPEIVPALAAAAIRELQEETGFLLGVPGTWPGDVPEGWEPFAAAGLRPAAQGLRFVFRAITPRGRSRRFDARFFTVMAEDIASSPDDFSRASDELSHLQWVPMADTHGLDLPFITEVVLAETRARLERGSDDEAPVPFFDNRGPRAEFRRIG